MDNENCFRIDMVDKLTMEKSRERPTTPCYADIVNYLVCGIVPFDFSYQKKKKLFSDAKYYQWEDPLLYKYYAN